MMPIRTILTAALLFAILPIHAHINAQPPNSETATAKSLLDQATKRLENQHSIQGNITYQADLLGHQISGKGSYAELRTKRIPFMRMELKIPLDDKMGALVRVCDGRYLWIYRKVLDHESLEQIDMDRVQDAVEKKHGKKQSGFQTPLSSIGAGGLATMVQQLADNFDFATPTESKLDRMPIRRLEGTWNRANLLRMLPKQKTAIEQGKAPDLTELPPHIPNQVVVSLGARDLFPYRIEYLRSPEGKSSPAGQGRGAPLMTIYLYNVQFDQPMDEAQFDYRPGELEPVDRTLEYIEKLK